MKVFILLTVFLVSISASAKELCASNVSEIANIKAITKKVDLFGSWTGAYDGKAIAAEFGKATSGKFTGKVSYDGKSYGPYGIKLCDDGGQFSAHVFLYEASFKVLSSKKIAVQLPIDGNPVVSMTKQSRFYDVYDLEDELFILE